jgi:hypothetical protein
MPDAVLMESFPLGTHVKIMFDGAKYMARVVGYKRRDLVLRLLVKRPFGDIVTAPENVERVCARS